ncbi:MAG: hypothetical protein JOY60_04340 [Burkholderiaceae bacterium]|nr:hypothetical protein [Roseateles sp.]MBV8469076.1 hypothetical protein [Burkholderiaceae bacterium]
MFKPDTGATEAHRKACSVIRLIAVLATGAMLSSCGGGGTNAMPATPSSAVVLGYVDQSDASLADAMSGSTPVSAVSVDAYLVGADGSVTGTAPADLLASAAAAHRDVWACVSNYGATDFDPDIAHGAIVTHPATTIANLVALANTLQVTGINIDFEGLYPADRDAYTAFVAALATQLHGIGSRLMLSVPAKAVDDPNDSWGWPYDYAALAQHADLIQDMTYAEHVPSGAPGPIAGSDWMQASLQYAVSNIPPSKLLLGLPAYAADWNLTARTGVELALKDIPALLSSSGAAAQWDAVTNTAYFNYTATDGSSHQVWYDTHQGLQVKARYATTMQLAGVSMWVLGDEDASFWSAVKAGLN